MTKGTDNTEVAQERRSGRIDWPDVDVLREWYCEEGMTHEDIAERLGCSKSSVSKRLPEVGISSTKGAPVNWPPPDVIEFWYLGKGMSQVDIAERLGCDPSSVSRRLSIEGIESRGPTPRKDQAVDWPPAGTLREWYWGDKLSQLEISDRVGCHRSSVVRKFEHEGIETRCGSTAIDLSKTHARFIRYTRWAVGDTLREFADRVGSSSAAISYWEGGRGIGYEHVDTWCSIVELGKRHGVCPKSPRRHMYWRDFLDVLGELLYAIDCTKERLSAILGVSQPVVGSWLLEKNRPLVGNHKAVRDLAELHGVWSPPDPITDDSEVDDSPEPEAELSDSDKQMIAVMHEQGASISDLAMMYGVGLAKISDALGEG